MNLYDNDPDLGIDDGPAWWTVPLQFGVALFGTGVVTLWAIRLVPDFLAAFDRFAESLGW